MDRTVGVGQGGGDKESALGHHASSAGVWLDFETVLYLNHQGRQERQPLVVPPLGGTVANCMIAFKASKRRNYERSGIAATTYLADTPDPRRRTVPRTGRILVSQGSPHVPVLVTREFLKPRNKIGAIDPMIAT